MKNKEESSAHSQRGNSWRQADLPLADNDGIQTRSSTLRPNSGGASVAARVEQPALSLLPEFLMDAVVDEPNVEPVLLTLLGELDVKPLLNRRMRTRMYGGVGGAVSDGRAYPISSILHVLPSIA